MEINNRFVKEYKKYSKQDQRLLAIWAADCAEHVLPLFEKTNPKDDRSREAIETGRRWVRTGVFKMSEIRGASLAAHAAARETKNKSACFAARAAGQAVATAHVPQHAYGAAYYALKAVAASDPDNAEAKIAEELNWIMQHLPENLRREVLSRIIVQKNGNKFSIKIRKSKDF
jgi:hypothetical protein